MSTALRFLLDTNVLSETRRTQPDKRVMSFLAGVDSSALHVSVLTLGELRKGIALKQRSDAAAARKLAAWVDGLEYSFAGHVLGIDVEIARLWGELSAEMPRPVVDTLLAATAIVHDLTLVTRNTTDVQGIKVKLLNPWKEGI
ncbi:MAG TPA: type II toxin-antitoxin system VapC family toxin [Acidobacteriaceae bacterium]|nr:type II toxin-antitoxin system VapC family toxin [Acidobacteriaceae bacterium]